MGGSIHKQVVLANTSQDQEIIRDVITVTRTDFWEITIMVSPIRNSSSAKLQELDQLILQGLGRAFDAPEIDKVILKSHGSPKVLFSGWGGSVKQWQDLITCCVSRAQYDKLHDAK